MADNKLYDILGVNRDANDSEIKKVSANRVDFHELNIDTNVMTIELCFVLSKMFAMCTVFE